MVSARVSLPRIAEFRHRSRCIASSTQNQKWASLRWLEASNHCTFSEIYGGVRLFDCAELIKDYNCTRICSRPEFQQRAESCLYWRPQLRKDRQEGIYLYRYIFHSFPRELKRVVILASFSSLGKARSCRFRKVASRQISIWFSPINWQVYSMGARSLFYDPNIRISLQLLPSLAANTTSMFQENAAAANPGSESQPAKRHQRRESWAILSHWYMDNPAWVAQIHRFEGIAGGKQQTLLSNAASNSL